MTRIGNQGMWENCLILLATTQLPQQKTHKTHNTRMHLNIEGFDGQTYVVDVGVDDTAKHLRQKVAAAAGFAEDSFDMGFGRDDEGEDINITALSAGDTVVLTQKDSYKAIAALRALGETDLTPARLARVEDPEVAQLFLQAQVVTAIPHTFLTCTNLRSLDLSAPLAITAIGDHFLSQCSSLESVNLSGLRNVTTIGECFLYDCTSLRTFEPFNFAGLSSVTSIGTRCLAKCTALTTIDFAGLSSVTSLGHCFLSGSMSLTSIDFAGLSNVTSLGNFFLSCSKSLTTIDFAGLSSVTSLGDYFLLNCAALTAIDIAGLSAVTRTGSRFLEGCTSLETQDLAALRAIEGRQKCL